MAQCIPWVRRTLNAASLALAVAGIACGARTDPLDDRAKSYLGLDEADGGGDGPRVWGPCVACSDAPDFCKFCYVQGQVSTWLCPVSNPKPSDQCYGLEEVHWKEGWTYTCAYCM